MVSFSRPIFPIHPLPVPPSLTKRPVVLAFLVLLLLRSRTLSLTKGAITILREGTQYLSTFQRKRKLTKEELAKVLQQVYVDEPDDSQSLLVPYRERVVKVRDVIQTTFTLPLRPRSHDLLGPRSCNAEIPVCRRQITFSPPPTENGTQTEHRCCISLSVARHYVPCRYSSLELSRGGHRHPSFHFPRVENFVEYSCRSSGWKARQRHRQSRWQGLPKRPWPVVSSRYSKYFHELYGKASNFKNFPPTHLRTV